MKFFKPFAIFFMLLFITSGCATTSAPTAGKYDLDEQLEAVSEILRYNLMGWEAVDNQSFILQTSPSDYYLIVLISPSDRLRFTEDIGITHTGNMVKPGYDKVIVYSSPYTETFVISKIFRLQDREEANAVRERLSGG